MEWPLQGTPRKKLATVVSCLRFNFVECRAKEDGKLRCMLDSEQATALADEYGITNLDICRLLVELAPEAARYVSERMEFYENL